MSHVKKIPIDENKKSCKFSEVDKYLRKGNGKFLHF